MVTRVYRPVKRLYRLLKAPGKRGQNRCAKVGGAFGAEAGAGLAGTGPLGELQASGGCESGSSPSAAESTGGDAGPGAPAGPSSEAAAAAAAAAAHVDQDAGEPPPGDESIAEYVMPQDPRHYPCSCPMPFSSRGPVRPRVLSPRTLG